MTSSDTLKLRTGRKWAKRTKPQDLQAQAAGESLPPTAQKPRSVSNRRHHFHGGRCEYVDTLITSGRHWSPSYKQRHSSKEQWNFQRQQQCKWLATKLWNSHFITFYCARNLIYNLCTRVSLRQMIHKWLGLCACWHIWTINSAIKVNEKLQNVLNMF